MKDHRQSLNDSSPSTCPPIHAQGDPPFSENMNSDSPHQIPASSSKETDPRSDLPDSGVSSFAAACSLSPTILDSPIYVRSLALLRDIGIEKKIAQSLALSVPFRRVFDAVARGRISGARNPPGLVRTILETDGPVHPTLKGAVQAEVLREIEADLQTRKSPPIFIPPEWTKPLPGESEEERLRRVQDEAVRRNRERSKSKGTAMWIRDPRIGEQP